MWSIAQEALNRESSPRLFSRLNFQKHGGNPRGTSPRMRALEKYFNAQSPPKKETNSADTASADLAVVPSVLYSLMSWPSIFMWMRCYHD